MDQEEARARCLSRPAKRYEIYSNKKRNKEPRQSVRMPRNSSLQPIEESSKNGARAGSSGPRYTEHAAIVSSANPLSKILRAGGPHYR
ncbi:hypothetical protein TKK_0019299 [Trichogramma kaykai]|uniref:Uncharacterized protein n=1 Tax=Trichogramma kaykai TaxID=54128 RepID=A0ABD2VSY1_9HYME